MKKLFLILLVVLFFINLASVIKLNPPSSEAVLKGAFTQAARENKKVLIIFHASWCGRCHKMETTNLKEADIAIIHHRFLLNQELI